MFVGEEQFADVAVGDVRTHSHSKSLGTVKNRVNGGNGCAFFEGAAGVKKSRAPGLPGSYVLCDGAKYCRRNRCSFPPLTVYRMCNR